MSDLRDKFENARDKFIGEVTEAVGKVTGNEEQELKGKIQSKMADLDKDFDDSKDNLVEKINDMWDKKDEEKK